MKRVRSSYHARHLQLSLALLAAVFAGGSFASAPGDSDKFCDDTYTFLQEEKVLMYSRNYAELLPGSGTGKPPLPNAVWSDVSCDSNDQIDTTHPTFVSFNDWLCVTYYWHDPNIMIAINLSRNTYYVHEKNFFAFKTNY